jgi:hypothetical protein
MHSLIAHFQDLSKDDTLVMVCVLELTKTQTTPDKWLVMGEYRDMRIPARVAKKNPALAASRSGTWKLRLAELVREAR